MKAIYNLSITRCNFKRNSDSKWENGITINEGKLILDMDGNVVKAPITDYRIYAYKGTMVVKETQYD